MTNTPKRIALADEALNMAKRLRSSAGSRWSFYIPAGEAADLLERLAALRATPDSDGVREAAKYLAETVKDTSWDGLRKDGRASDSGFPPWSAYNARQQDYIDVVLEIMRLAAPPSSGTADTSSLTLTSHGVTPRSPLTEADVPARSEECSSQRSGHDHD